LLADTAARWLTVIALLTGVATSLWLIDGKDTFAIERMVTVIVIVSHALVGCSLVVAKSTPCLAKNGLLIKNRTAFEIPAGSQLWY